MNDWEYVGIPERDPDGTVRIRRPHIPPAPVRIERPVPIPWSVERQLARGRAYVAGVIGDSMQPTILDNDTIVVSTIRAPRHRDIVVVKGPHPVCGAIKGYVWRYYVDGDRIWLGKDNPRYSEPKSVAREEILGIITRVLPRTYRNEQENYVRIQQDRALLESLSAPVPPDLGFYRPRFLCELRTIFSIPDPELLDGRLPWGAFRARVLTNQEHVGITTKDTLTVDPAMESKVGRLVVECADDGAIILGILQRDGLGSGRPGKFFIETAERRVDITRKDGYPLYRTIAVIARIERHGVVVPPPQPAIVVSVRAERRRA